MDQVEITGEVVETALRNGESREAAMRLCPRRNHRPDAERRIEGCGTNTLGSHQNQANVLTRSRQTPSVSLSSDSFISTFDRSQAITHADIVSFLAKNAVTQTMAKFAVSLLANVAEFSGRSE